MANLFGGWVWILYQTQHYEELVLRDDLLSESGDSNTGCFLKNSEEKKKYNWLRKGEWCLPGESTRNELDTSWEEVRAQMKLDSINF